MDNPFLGMIILFAGNFAPRGWALCDGQLLPISQNAPLFSLLGTFYGGDGIRTFALPDLRGRVAVHQGQLSNGGQYDIGEQLGSEHMTLTVNNLPNHNHNIMADTTASGKTTPANTVLGPLAVNAAEKFYSGNTPTTKMNAAMCAPTGGSQSFPILQPLLVVNFIIALEGIFPSRN